MSRHFIGLISAVTLLGGGLPLSGFVEISPSATQIASNKTPTVRDQQWHLQYLRVLDAHRVSVGAGVVVALPDTGVDPHPDLQLNLLAGISTLPEGVSDGHRDSNGHGTGMAGLIAAHGQRGNIGALGIAPAAKILPIIDSLANGDTDPDALARAIEYAVSRNADVISISSGGGSTPRLRQAVRSALASDVVIVAGAGNAPFDQRVAYPASEAGALAVGGVDRAGNHAAISVTGPEVDVVAPAVEIFSTSKDGNFRKATGTSGATAIVAGAAALVRSKYPDLPASEVVHRLTATAVDKGPPGRDDQYGYGVIDLVAALTADVPPLGFTSSPPVPTASQTQSAARPETGSDDGGSTVRGLLTLGVLVSVGGIWAAVARRRRLGDDPPPRISR